LLLIARVRELLAAAQPISDSEAGNTNRDGPRMLNYPCPCYGGPMIVIETFERGAALDTASQQRRTSSESTAHDRVCRCIDPQCLTPPSLVLNPQHPISANNDHCTQSYAPNMRHDCRVTRVNGNSPPSLPARLAHRAHHNDQPAALKSP
jgi:hypothetical protein